MVQGVVVDFVDCACCLPTSWCGRCLCCCLRCCCPVNGFPSAPSIWLLLLIVCHGVKWFPSCNAPFPFSPPPLFLSLPLSVCLSPTQDCFLLEIPFTCLCTSHSSHLGGPPFAVQFELHSFNYSLASSAPIAAADAALGTHCFNGVVVELLLHVPLCGGYFYLAFCTIYSLWLLSRLLKQGQHFINTLQIEKFLKGVW